MAEQDQGDWLYQRLTNKLPKDHPDYDAFFDASDDELAEMISNGNPPWSESQEGTDGQQGR